MLKRYLTVPVLMACLTSLSAAWAAGVGPQVAGRLDALPFLAPPTFSSGQDGFGFQVRMDPAFRRPRTLNADSLDTTGIVRVGEVVVIPGDPETVSMVGPRFGIDLVGLRALARKAIAYAGDNFEIITFWVTFDDRGTDALAYAFNVRNDVAGLGRRLPQQDFSAAYGSSGTLRTVVNMKSLGLAAGDERAGWTETLETWGQETGHRFMAYMDVRDPRTGRSSDLLLGRDCAHFDWFVDTQASVQDGLSWRDNANGTFTRTERSKRYGWLDLYGMGLLAADEVPPFFAIVDVPTYARKNCEDFEFSRIPMQQTVTGTRLDLSIADIIAANGPREPAISSGYMRELQVVVTRPNEAATSTTAQALAARIDRARLWWEEWALAASANRLLVCTKSTGDCGDARSDVVQVQTVPPAVPAAGAVEFRVDLANTGARAASGIKAWVEVQAGDATFSSGAPRPVEDLAAGATRTETFAVNLGAVPCGTVAKVVARTQSNVHYHRLTVSRALGTEVVWGETFEADSGWVVNPEGTDDGKGATWERGTPQLSFVFDRQTQVQGAHAGTGAFATGLVPPDVGRSGGFVRGGRVTLQSPVVASAGLRSPQLHYVAAVAAMEAAGGGGVTPSMGAYLAVQVRPLAAGGDAGAAGWREIDRLSNQISFTWQERVVPLPAELDLSAGLQFRFVAADDNVQNAGGVEAAVDSLELLSNVAACAMGGDGDDAGCGCRVGERTRSPGPWMAAMLAGLAAFAFRRRW